MAAQRTITTDTLSTISGDTSRGVIIGELVAEGRYYSANFTTTGFEDPRQLAGCFLLASRDEYNDADVSTALGAIVDTHRNALNAADATFINPKGSMSDGRYWALRGAYEILCALRAR